MSKLSLDVRKCKSGQVAGLQRHDQREPGERHGNDSIDDSRTHLNYDLCNDEKINFTDFIKQRITDENIEAKRAVRSDANVMISVVVQQNKDFFDKLSPEKTREYFKTAYDLLCDEYGKQNVMSAIVHMDEKAPHMHFKFVPIRDGKLQGGKLTNKPHLIQLHTKVANRLKAKGFDVQRGDGMDHDGLHPEQFKVQEARRELERAEGEIYIQSDKLSKEKEGLVQIAAEKNEVSRIRNLTEEKKDFFGKGKGIVEVSKQEFDKLAATAEAGAIALEENKRLTEGNNNLQRQITELRDKNRQLVDKNYDLEKQTFILKDKDVAQLIYDKQNPHLSKYRELKENLRKDSLRIRAHGMENKDYQEIAYSLTKAGFSHVQVREALAMDLHHEQIYDMVTAADQRVQQERSAAEIQRQRAAEQAAREAKVAAERQQIEQNKVNTIINRRREKVRGSVELTRFANLTKQGHNPTSIAVIMRKEGYSESRVKGTIKFMCGNSEKYAERVMKEVQAYQTTHSTSKTVSRASSASVGGSSGGGTSQASHKPSQSLLSNILKDDSKAVPLSLGMIDGTTDIDWDMLTPEQVQDKVREIQIERDSWSR